MTDVINIVTNLVGADKVHRGLNDMTGALGGLAKIGAGSLIAFGTAAATAFISASKSLIDYGDQLHNASLKTGVTVEALSQLYYAAGLSDVSTQALEKSLGFMSRSIAEAGAGTGKASAALQTLNINYDALSKLKPEDQFTVIADKIAGIEDPSLRAEAAAALLGRGYQDLMPLIADGAKGLTEMREAADKMGGTMSADTARAMDGFNDAMGALTKSTGFAFQAVFEELVPALTELTLWLGDLVPKSTELFVSAFKNIINAVTSAYDLVKSTFSYFGSILDPVANALKMDNSFFAWAGKAVEAIGLVDPKIKLLTAAFNLLGSGAETASKNLEDVTKSTDTLSVKQEEVSKLIKDTTGSLNKNTEAVKKLADAEQKAAEQRQKHFEDANEAHKEVLSNLDIEIRAMERRDRQDAQDAFEESARIQRILNEEVEAMDRRDKEDASNKAKEAERTRKAIAGMSAWERAWKSYEQVALGVFGTVNEHMVGSVADSKRALGTMFGDIFTKTETVGDSIKKFFGTVKDSILRSLGEILADKIWQTLASSFVGGAGAAGGAGALGGALGGAAGGAGGSAAGGGGSAAGGGLLASYGPIAAAAALVLYASKGKDELLETLRAPFGGLLGGNTDKDNKLDDKLHSIGRDVGDFFGFASGTDSVFSRPTMFLAGENGPERVQVTPTNQHQRGGSGGHTYNFYGPVMMDQIAIDKFQRGLMKGMSNQSRRFG